MLAGGTPQPPRRRRARTRSAARSRRRAVAASAVPILERRWLDGPGDVQSRADEMAANSAGRVEASTFSTQNATTDPNYTMTESSARRCGRTGRRADPGGQHARAACRRDLLAALVASINTITPTGGGRRRSHVRACVGESGAQYTGAIPTAALPSGVTKREPLATLPTAASPRAAATGSRYSTRARSWTSRARADRNSRRPPGSDKWVVIGAWMNGTGQTRGGAADDVVPARPLLDRRLERVKDYWETKVLTPEMKRRWAANGGSLFFDSFELNRSGQQVRHWAPNFLAEFQPRRGYSLVPYLPVVAVTTPASTSRATSARACARTTTRPSATCCATTTCSPRRRGRTASG